MKRKGYDLHRAADLATRHILGLLNDTEEKEFRRMSRETKILQEDSEKDDIVRSAFLPGELSDERRLQAYRQFREYTHKKNRSLVCYCRRIAAIAVLLMAIGGGIYYFSGNVTDIAPPGQEIIPAQARAYLLLSDGSRIDLSAAHNGKDIYKDNITVCDSGKLEYGQQADKPEQPGTYNQIFVPRGGEYQLILSDGTKVWINAESELKYPVQFGSGSREVYLRGEAYFEVKKDAVHPFIISTSKGAVKVLGTEFNVRDYSDEAEVVTTLVKGSVEYRTSVSRVVLKPGFQSVDAGSGVRVQRVNIDEYAGWKDGKYIFFDKSLDDLMRYVERVYDAEVFFANKTAKQLRFSGDLQRYDRVELFLRYLERSGDVHFSIHEKTITVYKK